MYSYIPPLFYHTFANYSLQTKMLANLGGKDLKACIKILIDSVFTHEVQGEINWFGRRGRSSPNGETKYSLKETLIASLLIGKFIKVIQTS